MAKQISDEAVYNKTGKRTDEWFKLIDKAGGKKMNHKEIVSFIGDNFEVSQWWQQMITVEYEKSRGLRKKHEKPEGFQISKSKTINVDLPEVFKTVKDKRKRSKWIPDPDIDFTTINENKSLRGKWKEDFSNFESQLYSKGENKTQIVIQISKIKSAKEAEKLKTYWADNLNKLKGILEE